MRIRIQLLFLMRIRIQLIKICNKLPYEEYSGVKKYKQDYSKVKNHRADANLLTIKTNFLAFFCYFPKKSPSGSGSTALPTYIKVVLYKYHFIRGKTNFVIYCWLVWLVYNHIRNKVIVYSWLIGTFKIEGLIKSWLIDCQDVLSTLLRTFMSECQKKRNAKEWNSILIVTLTASVENPGPELLPGSGIIGSGSVKNKRAD